MDFVSTAPGVLPFNLLDGIPFPDASFDTVYHSHLLEHFTADQAKSFLNQCFRVLKPEGIIRVVVPDLEQITRAYLDQLSRATAGERLAADNHHWMLVELLDQCTRHVSGGEMQRLLERKSLANWDFIESRLGDEVTQFRKVLLDRKQDQASTCTPRSTYRSKLATKVKRWLLARLNVDSEFAEIGKFRMSGEVHRWMYDRFSLGQALKEAGFVDIEKVDAYTSRIPGWEHHQELDVQDGKTRKPDSLFMEARRESSQRISGGSERNSSEAAKCP